MPSFAKATKGKPALASGVEETVLVDKAASCEPKITESSEENKKTNSSGFVSQLQSKVPILDNRSKSFFLFIVASTAIIGLVAIFFLGFPSARTEVNQVRQNLVGVPKLNLQSPNFEDESGKLRFEEFINKAQELKNSKEAAENYVKAFIFLSDEYNRSPSGEKRDALVKISEYLKKYFDKESQEAKLEVPCREEVCGAKFTYSDDLSSLKKLVESQKDLSSLQREILVKSLDDVALAEGSGRRSVALNGLSAVFQSLRNSWQQTNKPSIKVLAQKVLDLIQKTDANFYEIGTKL